MMLRTYPHGVGRIGETADIVADVNWPSDRPATDPGWSWDELPDLPGGTILPSGGSGIPGGAPYSGKEPARVPTQTAPSWLDKLFGGGETSGSGVLPTGGIDIGIPGFGMGPEVNVDTPLRDKIAGMSSAILAIGALILGVVVVGQIRK
jgi:hypothetical protein